MQSKVQNKDGLYQPKFLLLVFFKCLLVIAFRSRADAESMTLSMACCMPD